MWKAPSIGSDRNWEVFQAQFCRLQESDCLEKIRVHIWTFWNSLSETQPEFHIPLISSYPILSSTHHSPFKSTLSPKPPQESTECHLLDRKSKHYCQAEPISEVLVLSCKSTGKRGCSASNLWHALIWVKGNHAPTTIKIPVGNALCMQSMQFYSQIRHWTCYSAAEILHKGSRATCDTIK